MAKRRIYQPAGRCRLRPAADPEPEDKSGRKSGWQWPPLYGRRSPRPGPRIEGITGPRQKEQHVRHRRSQSTGSFLLGKDRSRKDTRLHTLYTISNKMKKI